MLIIFSNDRSQSNDLLCGLLVVVAVKWYWLRVHSANQLPWEQPEQGIPVTTKRANHSKINYIYQCFFTFKIMFLFDFCYNQHQ